MITANTKNHIDFYYGAAASTTRAWDSLHSANDGQNRRNVSNKTYNERVPSVNTKLLPITSKSPPSNRVSNPLKLTLIQTNGHSFVANNYPDSFNTNFYRWPVAAQSPSSTNYDIKWRRANNPFASHFNPTIESIPIPTTAPKPTTTTTTLATTTTTLPTAYVHRTDHRVHSKHHTSHGYVKTFRFASFKFHPLFC